MQVWLNHSRYPSVDMATDFTEEQYACVYKSFYNFASRYYGARPSAFKSLYLIHVFDVVDLTVMMEFSANVPTNTQAYALVISDRMLKFKSDGSKMSVLFQMRYSIEMELCMKELLVRTKPKDSFTLVVSDSSANIQTTFNTPLYLEAKRNYELAIGNLETYYSFANI